MLSGKVSDASGDTLPGASVLIKNSENKIIVYGITSENGQFSLAVKDVGEYTLEVNFMGFEKQTQKIVITPGSKPVYDFQLKESAETLKEIVIETELAVKRRGDTLVYDAKKLATGHEVVVEDLLRNIPGITIQKNGQIYYGDREIEKVMVDGDDLFNKGYSLLTRNMPTQPLDKVEVLENYSNNKLLKGIENSNAVALNLTIDEKFKNLWFGDVSLAYGNDSSYNAGGNLMNFSSLYKNFFTFNLNNAGYDKIGNINDMIYSSSELSSIGGGNAVSVINMGLPRPPLDELRSRFNNSKMATLSTVIPLTKKIKLQFKGFLGFDELSAWSNSFSVVDIPGTYFENFQANSAVNSVRKGYLSAYLNYDISTTSMLQSFTAINNGRNDFRNRLVFNSISTSEALNTESSYFDQKLTYTYQWDKRTAVLLKGRFLTDRLPQHYSIDDYLLGSLFSFDPIYGVGNNVQSKKQFGGLEADFKLRQKNNDLISFNIGFDSTQDNLGARFSLFTDSGVVQPDDFQSKSVYRVGDLYANGGYAWQFKKLTVSGNLSVHQLFNSFENKDGNSTRQNPFFVNPYLSAIYKFNPQNSLTASYSYRINNSSLLQVNDAYLLTSSRNFSKGLGYFNQMESTSAKVNYSTKHYLNRYNFTWSVDYSKQYDAIRSSTLLEQNSSLSEAFVIKGGDQLGAAFNSHFVIKKLQGSMKAGVRAGRFVYYNIINNSGLRKNTSYSQTYVLEWRSDFKAEFDFSLGTEWDFFQTESEKTFENSNKVSFLDLMYKAGKNFTLKIASEHYSFGGLDRNNSYFFSDLETSYSFKDKKYIVSLDARNLFDTKTFTTYSISDYGCSTNSYRLLPRYVLLGLKFRF